MRERNKPHQPSLNMESYICNVETLKVCKNGENVGPMQTVESGKLAIFLTKNTSQSDLRGHPIIIMDVSNPDGPIWKM